MEANLKALDLSRNKHNGLLMTELDRSKEKKRYHEFHYAHNN